MKHWVLKQHCKECIESSEKMRLNEETNHFAAHCERNYSHILFYHDSDYYLLSVHNCWLWPDRYSAIQDIFNQIGLKTKLKTKFNRDYNLDERMKRARIDGIVLEDEVIEINYIYEGVGKTHAITSVISIYDAIEGHKNYRINYDKMMIYLKENGFEYLEKELNMLHDHNWLIIPNEREIIKTIDNIILNINGNN